MHGRELFRFASQKGAEMLREACSLAGLSTSEVDCVRVHQANLRILECLQARTGIAPEKWLVNINRIGNTAAPSVLLVLADLLNSEIPAKGTRILLGAFGAGLTWCAAVLEWGVPYRDEPIGNVYQPAGAMLSGTGGTIPGIDLPARTARQLSPPLCVTTSPRTRSLEEA
jgi:3-oxoacyl-[acyl-carrier-protein] synthase-3